MGLPSKLKNYQLFNDGQSYLGIVESFSPPKLSRKLEKYRAGGMIGSAEADLGLDDSALDVSWSVGGYTRQVLKQIGAVGVAGVQLRLASAWQRDDTMEVDAVEYVIRGRHFEIDRGESKVGDNTTWKITTKCVYYKETINGEVIIEIDTLNLIYMAGGVDVSQARRQAIGM